MCVGRSVEEIYFPTVEIKSDCSEAQYRNQIVDNDIVAICGRHSRVVIFGVGKLLKLFQNTTFYKILCHTTQPAHLVTAISVLTIATLLSPCKADDEPKDLSKLWTLIYLGSFSLHFGAQIWMTFVSGLSLYFSIPRHTFGCVQKVLFPKYFLLNAVLSFITLSVFLKIHSIQINSVETTTQAVAMALCFMIELIIRLYFTAPLLKLISGKNKIEEDAGVGMEVGRFDPGTLLENEEYMKLHKSFRTVHMIIAIGNVITMGCTMLHLHYLSQKISIL